MTAPSTDEPLWSGEDQWSRCRRRRCRRWPTARCAGCSNARRQRRRDVRSAVGSLVHALVADPGKTESRWCRARKGLGKLPFESSGMPTTNWTGTGRCCRLSRSGARRPVTSSPRSAPRSTSTVCSTATAGRGAGPRPAGPARTRQSGPPRRRRRQDREEPGQQGRSPATCPARDVPAGHCRRAAAAGGFSPAAGGWSTSARPAAAGPPSGTGRADARRPRRVARDGAEAAAATQGPQFVARINDGCAHCPVRRIARPRRRPRTAP